MWLYLKVYTYSDHHFDNITMKYFNLLALEVYISVKSSYMLQ